MHDIEFLAKKQLNDLVWTYSFTKPKNYSFIAGQYAEFTLPHTPRDNRGDRRIFTLTSSPSDGLLSIILDFPINCSSFKKAFSALKAGDKLKIAEPMGDLITPIDSSRQLIFLAGGLGIASFSSNLKEIIDGHVVNPVELHYAARHQEDLLLTDLIKRSGVKTHSYISGQNRIDPSAIAAKQPSNALYFISGSEQFVMNIRQSLISSNVNPSSIIFDYFTGYSDGIN